MRLQYSMEPGAWGAQHAFHRAKGASGMDTVVCPNCQTRYRVADAAAGKRATCKKCGREFLIPAAPADPPDFLIELEPLPTGLKADVTSPAPDATADPEQYAEESRGRSGMGAFRRVLRTPVDPGVVSCILFLCAFSLNLICVDLGCRQNDKLYAKGVQYPGPPDAMTTGVCGALILHLAGLVLGGIVLAGPEERRGIAATGCALNALGLALVICLGLLQLFTYSRYP